MVLQMDLRWAIDGSPLSHGMSYRLAVEESQMG